MYQKTSKADLNTVDKRYVSDNMMPDVMVICCFSHAHQINVNKEDLKEFITERRLN